jgi:hypothetical protein
MDIAYQDKKFLIAKGLAPSSLPTVGYTIYNQDGASVVPFTQMGIVEIGGGEYGAFINFEPQVFQLDFAGYISFIDGLGGQFNEAINIVSNVSENVLMLLDKNIEYEFVIATVADPSRNVLVGMYDGMIVKHKLNSQTNFENPIFEDFIRFTYGKPALDSDVIKKSVAEDIDGYTGYGYGYGY